MEGINTASLEPQKRSSIVAGFTLQWMKLLDADTGKVLWESNWKPENVLSSSQIAKVPAEILKCKAVSREISFSSKVRVQFTCGINYGVKEAIQKFNIKQKVYIQDMCIEEWNFEFGFVIPGSTNTWQNTIVAAQETQSIPPQFLSGNVTILTEFYDGQQLISKNTVTVYYV